MRLVFSRWLFNQIHSRNLIYNQCWEDPALDREVLKIGAADRIVTITSAGCNALDYLLNDPAAISCVDVNPNQNALLELKIAAIETLPYEQFFEMFGSGRIRNHVQVYRDKLRGRLTPQSRQIWDRHIGYFNPEGRGLYFNGAAGVFARGILWYLKTCRGLDQTLEEFQRCGDLQAQSEFYHERIAPKLWSPLVRFLMNRPAALSMLGVPIEQMQQIERSSGGVGAFVEDKVAGALTRTSIHDNYFWRVYINGRYAENCCPNYLRKEHFEVLRSRLSRIRIHTSTLTDLLEAATERYSVFVLLDHMDWLSAAPDLLNEEWRFIMMRALPGARIIYRSAAISCDYLPEFAARRLHFEPLWTAALNHRDRVGTYASFHFATVTS